MAAPPPSASASTAAAASTATPAPTSTSSLISSILFFRNPFDVLRADPRDPFPAWERQFKRLALRCHPDKCDDPRAADALARLRSALDSLADVAQRQAFERIMREAADEVLLEKRQRLASAAYSNSNSSSNGNGNGTARGDGPLGQQDTNVVEISTPEDRRALQLRTQALLEKHAHDFAKAQRNVEANERRGLEEALAKREAAASEAASQREWEKNREARVDGWREFQRAQRHGMHANRQLGVDSSSAVAKKQHQQHQQQLRKQARPKFRAMGLRPPKPKLG